MKKNLLFFLIVLSGCSNSQSDQAALPESNTYTLVFLDKTQSVNPGNDFVRTKYSGAIKGLVDENIRTEGDFLEVYFIHENTSKGRALSVRSKTTKEDTYGLSPTDLEAADNAYNLSIQRERQMITNALLQKLMEANPSASNAETHVSAAVEVIAAALESRPRVSAWFFSDMVESRKAGRDFHKAPPQNPEQASTWAKEDAVAYKNYRLDGAEIHIILPFAPTSSTRENNPNVTVYWNTFFKELGAGEALEL